MENKFELNKLGWFVPQNVQENEFLNEQLEDDKFGIYYSVKFEDDASTHLWQAKTPPEEGKRYFGHIEMTKSGKATRFKRDKPPESEPTKAFEGANPQGQLSGNQKGDKAYLRDASTIPLDVYRVRANINGLPTNDNERRVFFENVMADSDELLRLIDNVRSGVQVKEATRATVADLKEPKSTPAANLKAKTQQWVDNPPSREPLPEEENG